MRASFDIGGTFTDVAVVDRESRRIWFGKALTTYDDFARGIANALEHAFRSAPRRNGPIDEPTMGATTLVTNALIERRGGRTALVTTRGFGDLLEIGRELRYDLYDLHLAFPEPLVPREFRLEVTERICADGRIDVPLASLDVETVVKTLREHHIDAVAICLLNAYVNDEHEIAIQRAIAEGIDGVFITRSSELVPEIREFERLSTTVANAYVQPVASAKIREIEEQLDGLGISRGLYLMRSDGGLIGVDQAARFPLQLLESGPAAGALGAAYWARRLGLPRMIAFDMGGTTAKLCIVDDGRPSTASSFEVARVHRFKPGSGITVRLPVIELIEIGAGGGSIARIDELGLLKVGPESAGASPGPACYGRGGTKPTVTDADLLLGYLDPTYFLGGRLALDTEAASEAIASTIARAFGGSVLDAAAGIVGVVEQNMATAARVFMTEQGRDPRGYTLVAFGGAAPVHACAVARSLGIEKVIVPASAGVLSAAGLQVARPMVSLVQTRLMRLSHWDQRTVEEVYATLRARARSALRAFESHTMTYECAVDMRFRGQGFEIEVDIDEDPKPNFVRERFLQRYQEIYGSIPPVGEPEVVSWRLRAYVPWNEIEFLDGGRPKVSTSASRKRRAWFRGVGTTVARVYRHEELPCAFRLDGPAIVEQPESTIIVGPFDRAVVDEFGHIHIDVASEG